MPTSLIDVDGVLVDIRDDFIEWWARASGKQLDPAAWTSTNLAECYGPDVDSGFWCYLESDDLYDDLPPRPGAVHFLQQLREVGKVYAVSYAMVGHATSKMRWLVREAGFTNKDIILAHKKSLVQGDVLIEDSPVTADLWPGPAVLIDQIWNQNFDERTGDRVYRAFNWVHVLELVKICTS